MINLHWSWILFTVIIIPLILLSVWKRKSTAGNFTPDLSGLSNLFWTIVTVIFILVFGGFFWW